MIFRIIKKNTNPSPSRTLSRMEDVYKPIPPYITGEEELMRFGGRMRRLFAPGGPVDDPTVEQADDNSEVNPATSPMPLDTSWPDAEVQQADRLVPNVSYDDARGMIGEIDTNFTPLLDNSFSAPDPKQVDNTVIQAASNRMNQTVDQTNQEDNEALNGDPTTPMSYPYYGMGVDLASRAQLLGNSIGRAGNTSGFNRGMNIMQGVAAGLSLGTGLARNIAGAAASERARLKDANAYRNKLARERKNSFIQYTEEGGEVNIGNGEVFNTSSLTGEYIYPMPKSMQDAANVEIEKGEYVLRPDVMGPMESKGDRHEKGGAPVVLPEGSLIISDYRKVTPDLVIHLAENYGIKASVKDTYASVVDKYKSKIGLKKLYDEQEKVLKRLKKNEDVKDTNTSDLNKSVLSQYISETQSKIDELEPRMREFADMVYNAQERDKKMERISNFFKDGGPVDLSKVKSLAKKSKISEDRAKELIYDQYRSMRRKRFAPGGEVRPSDEMMQWGRETGDYLRNLFGRQLTFSPVYVEGTDSILNPETGLLTNQGYQRTGQNGMYGRATAESIGRLSNVNRFGRQYLDPNNLDTEGFQMAYNDQMDRFYALGASNAISNQQEMQNFRNHGFWGESAGEGNIGKPNAAQNSQAVDDKYGQWTATRPFGSLDVVTPEQLRKLNEKDIRNFVDLFGDKAEDAKKILGDDYAKFKDMQSHMDGMDFVLGQYEPGKTPTAPNTIDMPQFNTDMQDPVLQPVLPEEKEETGFQGYVGRSSQAQQPRRNAGYPAGLYFPEVLREFPGDIVTEGLERHIAPHIDPVLRSADQYVNELNRATSAQMDALGDVPDSQRAAILANLNAVAGTNIAKYINNVEHYNTEQRNYANRFNTTAYTSTDDKNIAERQRYEAATLRAMGIADENRARYWDSINDEVQKKWNVATSMNTLSSIAPNMRMLPNGQIVYVPDGERLGVTSGDYSTPVLRAMREREENERRKG